MAHRRRRGGRRGTHRGVRVEPGRRVARNIAEIVRIEAEDRRRLGWSQRLADAVTAFGGSMAYVWLHVLWFSIWILLNTRFFGLPAFDAYPFSLLTMIVSLEAIFLSTFVLISQNREAAQADRRSHIDLQINMLAEQEITRLLEMVSDLHERMGLEQPHADDVAEMARPVEVEKVAKAVDRAEEDQ